MIFSDMSLDAKKQIDNQSHFFYNKLKGEFMFDKYLNLNKDNITEEQKKEAYEQIKIYAKENNTTVKKILSNDDNIVLAAEHIHKNLPFTARVVLKKDKIIKLITENIDFIREQAKIIEKEEKKCIN